MHKGSNPLVTSGLCLAAQTRLRLLLGRHRVTLHTDRGACMSLLTSDVRVVTRRPCAQASRRVDGVTVRDRPDACHNLQSVHINLAMLHQPRSN